MSDVRARLAAVECDAAPYGWSDVDKSGCRVFSFAESTGGCGWFGELIRGDGTLVPCSWEADGNDVYCNGRDLVPLPAPVQCPPVQKLATSGPSITRPVPAVDAWVTYGEHPSYGRYRVDCVETVNGETRIISGALSIYAGNRLTGPSDRGPWRPIGEVR